MRRLALVLLAAGVACGRAGFDRLPSKDAGIADAMVDARPIRLDASPPNTIGCADGEREGFTDRARFPTVAGCAGTWMGGHNLREARTGQPCGDDLAGCVSVAELCAVGWHICGDSGDATDLTSRVSGTDCLDSGGDGGEFVAAFGHCESCSDSCGLSELCVYAPTFGCPSTFAFCAEPVCCGPMCSSVTCRDGVYPDGMTRTGFTMEACGAMPALHTGVLCCSD